MAEAAILSGLLFLGSLVVLLVAAVFYWSAKREGAAHDGRMAELREAQELNGAVEALLQELDKRIQQHELRMQKLLEELESREEELAERAPRRNVGVEGRGRRHGDAERQGAENLEKRIPHGEAELVKALRAYQMSRGLQRSHGRRTAAVSRGRHEIWEELSS